MSTMFYDAEIKGAFLKSRIHPKLPILATCPTDSTSSVDFFDVDAKLIKRFNFPDTDLSSGVNVVCIEWHPLKPFLLIGYSNGI